MRTRTRRPTWRYFREGLALATSVDDVFMEQLNLYGVVDAATALRAPEAARVGLDTLARFYDTRNWAGIWALLNVLAEWLVSEENAEAAGVIYGHLEAHQHHPWDNQVVRRGRKSRGLDAWVSTRTVNGRWPWRRIRPGCYRDVGRRADYRRNADRARSSLSAFLAR